MHNPYHHGYGVGQEPPVSTRNPSSGVGTRPAGPGCGLPAPVPAGPAECAEQMGGGKYCRGHLGGQAALGPGASGTITLTPTNATEFVARWLHMTATTAAGVSPVAFTQAFTITAVRILGDNQLADNSPVIGSTWAAQQTYLEVYWERVITATNPAFIDVTNLDAGQAIVVFASLAGDFVKS